MSFDTEPQQQQKQGMSTGCKVLLILGIIFAILFVLCCGAAVVVTRMSMSWLEDSVSEDPAVVRTTAQEMADMTVPEAFQPQAAVNMKVPFSDERIIIAAVYGDEETRSVLIIGAMGEAFDPENQEEFRKGFLNSLRQQGVQSGDNQDFQIDETSTKEFVVRGKPATFVFNKGHDRKTGKKLIQVTGAFEGKTGPTMFIIVVDPEHYTEEDVIKIIESIK